MLKSLEKEMMNQTLNRAVKLARRPHKPFDHVPSRWCARGLRLNLDRNGLYMLFNLLTLQLKTKKPD